MWTDTECIALGNRYNFWSQEMTLGKDTAKELLTEGAGLHHADILVVGFHGRKGPKDDPTVMGTAVQYMGLNSKIPMLILKEPVQRKEKENGAYRFAAAIDGSNFSLKAIHLICKLRQPQDKIEIIICEQANLDSATI